MSRPRAARRGGRGRRGLADQHAPRDGDRAGRAAPGSASGFGGLSGPAIRAVALAQVAAVAARVEIPIVGMGGVSRGRDAADLLDAGATLVGVGTENFRDPAAGTRVAGELRGILSQIAG